MNRLFLLPHTASGWCNLLLRHAARTGFVGAALAFAVAAMALAATACGDDDFEALKNWPESTSIPGTFPGGTQDDDSSSGSSGSGANVRRAYVENLARGECIGPIDSDGYAQVLSCSEAQMQVLVVVQMPDSGWPGSGYLQQSANEYCPDETQWKYWPDQSDWIFGDRHILCLVRSKSVDSEFDSTSLSGRWTLPDAYLEIELDRVYEGSDGGVALYTFEDYSNSPYGLFKSSGSGEIRVLADGSAEIQGTDDTLVFICFAEEYEGILTFTQDEFFGSIWCEDSPSDQAELRGFRSR